MKNNSKVCRADLFHFGYPPLMKQFYQNDGRELETLLRTVKEAGVAVSLDLASVDATSEAGQANWQRILERALPWVDFFVPSAEELCFMLDPLRYEDWVRRAAGRDVAEILTPEEVTSLGERCLQLGARVVLIKCGSRGMYYRTAAAPDITPLCEKLSLAPSDWAGIFGFEKSFKPDAVRSGTGAGDTSIAAFLTAVLNGESLHSTVALSLLARPLMGLFVSDEALIQTGVVISIASGIAGYNGVLVAQPLSDLLTTVLAVVLYRRCLFPELKAASNKQETSKSPWHPVRLHQ
ncbi:MAG: PfkB family carbohydrate kinase [Clostridiales bacterium]|nr:PfkB family carbohydrate kinase [Clostridiales bacterium]